MDSKGLPSKKWHCSMNRWFCSLEGNLCSCHLCAQVRVVCRNQRLAALSYPLTELARRGYEFGHSGVDVRKRLDSLTTALQLDRERVRKWALAQTVAWSFEGTVAFDKHIQTAGWLL